jgi:hypothetical protein
MTAILTDLQQPTQLPASGSTNLQGDQVGGAHTTIVSIGVILLVTIILIEVAGMSHGAAIGVGFLFISVLAIAGITHQTSLQSVSQYPAVPQ